MYTIILCVCNLVMFVCVVLHQAVLELDVILITYIDF